MIYHRGGEPEGAMHCWFNVMAHKPWITAQFVTLLFHERGKQYFVQRGQWSYWGCTHALTKLHTEVMGWTSRAYECRLCMDLPEANSTTVRDLYCLWAACPCLSWSTVAMRALTWVVFVPRASFTLTLHFGSSPSLTQQWAGDIACTKGLHEIFKYTHLKFTVYGRKHTYIHTTSANAVTLVWGSLRLAPITHEQSVCQLARLVVSLSGCLYVCLYFYLY